MNPKLRKLLKIAACVLVCGAVVALSVRGMGGTAEEQLRKMTPEEREFCLHTLSQITSRSTRSDVIGLLGQPSRDLGLKVNWWVTLGQRRARVGVYFTPAGVVDEVVLDGGPGRYYYSRKVTRKADGGAPGSQQSEADGPE
jgi:hypothetical protein